MYGTPAPGLPEACRALGLPLHVFPWQPAMGRVGLTRDALYLVRPDGYIGLAAAGADLAALRRYVEGVRPKNEAEVVAPVIEATVT